MAACLHHLPVLSAGIILFDIWIANPDRHNGNLHVDRRTDPPSVVWDEIAAVPVCFAVWIALVNSQTGQLPGAAYFFAPPHMWGTLGVLAGFRVFDILKPWPVGASQRLPGGWGITVDDFLAAVYVNALTAGMAVLWR